MIEKPKPQHGGHNRGQISPRSKGSGPVFRLRKKLQMTQADFHEASRLSVTTIRRCEREGRPPKKDLEREALAQLARERGVEDFTFNNMTSNNLDGMRLGDAINHFLSLAKQSPSSALINVRPILPTEPPEGVPLRQMGFCQMCEHTLSTCICEDGPY